MLMLQLIAQAVILKKTAKLLFRFSSFFLHLASIYETLLLPLVLLKTTAKKKTLFMGFAVLYICKPKKSHQSTVVNYKCQKNEKLL